MTFRISASAYCILTHTHAYASYYLHVPRSYFIDRESWFGELCSGRIQGSGGVLKITVYWWAGYKSETFFFSFFAATRSPSLVHSLSFTTSPPLCAVHLSSAIDRRRRCLGCRGEGMTYRTAFRGYLVQGAVFNATNSSSLVSIYRLHGVWYCYTVGIVVATKNRKSVTFPDF